MNVDTDTQYAFTRPVAGYMFSNYDGVLKVDGEVGNKKQYDPRAWGKAAEDGDGRRASSRPARTCAAPARTPDERQPARHPRDPARRRPGRRAARAGRRPAVGRGAHTRRPRSRGPSSPRTRSDDGRNVEAYAYARTGYHRALDSLRKCGWRGQGPVPWSHEPNRGFLRALAALSRAAGAIGETDEERRCAEFLRDSSRDGAEALGL